MKIEQQMFRDQLAVELVKLLANGVMEYPATSVVNTSFMIADLTVERITKDLLALHEADKQQGVEEALIKAEELAAHQRVEAQAQAASAREFEERRKGGGINVVETDDLSDVLAVLRSIMGRN